MPVARPPLSPRPRRPWPAALAATACATVTFAVGAGPGPGPTAAHARTGAPLPLVLQDDAELLNRSPARVRDDLGTARRLGVDVVRLTASWSRIAPSPTAARRPSAPFAPADPTTYAPGAWDHLDVAVREARRAGLRVLVDVAFWAPVWAQDSPGPRRPRLRPDPAAFAAFAAAVARRYDGRSRGADGRLLPRVELFATWNEPNHPAFLAPQWKRAVGGDAGRGRGAWTAASADAYRAMHAAAAPAIRAASPGATVLLGNLAAIGGPGGTAGVPPLRFLRRLACVNDALRPVHDGACRRFRPVRADGLAFHPYTRYVPPGTPAAGRDAVALADQGRLRALLQALRRRGRLVLGADTGAASPVWLTEYGYEPREDDPYQPFTRADQARFVGWSTYLAWRAPGVVSTAQFLLRDIDPAESGLPPGDRRRYRDWQSGVLDRRGAPKPAAGALTLPFWPRVLGEGDGRRLWVFAAVRPGWGPRTFVVQRRDEATGAWARVPLRPCGAPRPGCGVAPLPSVAAWNGEARTDAQGVAVRTAGAVDAKVLRLLWRRPDGSWLAGPPIALTPEAEGRGAQPS